MYVFCLVCCYYTWCTHTGKVLLHVTHNRIHYTHKVRIMHSVISTCTGTVRIHGNIRKTIGRLLKCVLVYSYDVLAYLSFTVFNIDRNTKHNKKETQDSYENNSLTRRVWHHSLHTFYFCFHFFGGCLHNVKHRKGVLYVTIDPVDYKRNTVLSWYHSYVLFHVGLSCTHATIIRLAERWSMCTVCVYITNFVYMNLVYTTLGGTLSSERLYYGY
jgi:hypothetical protein